MPKYIVIAIDGAERPAAMQVTAPNPEKAVNKLKLGNDFDFVSVYQLARTEQPVAKFEAAPATEWVRVS